MAVQKMKKVRLLVPKDDREKLLTLLQNAGVVEIENIKEQLQAEGLTDFLPRNSSDLTDVDRRLTDIKQAIDFLRGFSEQKEGLLKSFLGTKIVIDPQTLGDLLSDPGIEDDVRQALRWEEELNEIRNRVAQTEELMKILNPWTALDLNLKTHGTNKTRWLLGTVPATRWEEAEGKLAAEPGLALQKVSPAGNPVRLAILVLNSALDTVEPCLKEIGFTEVNLPRLDGTPAEIMAKCRQELHDLHRREEEIKSLARGLRHKRLSSLMALYDAAASERRRRESAQMLGETKTLVFLEGWLPATREQEVKRLLENKFPRLAVEFTDPEEGDRVPVVLHNQGIAKPFEFVLNLYGMPQYTEVDPTALLTPFFLLFFGFCLTDAAYGLVLMGLSALAIKKLDLDEGGKRFFKLFFYGGASTVVLGALAGGWFGNAVDLLPAAFAPVKAVKNALTMFDPLYNPIPVLAVAMGLGLLQIMTGIAIKMVWGIKTGNAADALMDQGLWLVFLTGLVCWGMGRLGILSPAVTGVFKAVMLAGMIGLVLTQGRAQKGIVRKLFSGIMSLYGLVGYFGDVLSYSRLFALGLATGVIGMVVNIMAGLVGGIPVVGVILFIIIFVFGHAFNLALNVLGAFIHSSRLQFVEYFTKFFEGGGRMFRPLRRASKYTVVREIPVSTVAAPQKGASL